MRAIVAGEPHAFVPLPDVAEVEVSAELVDGGARLVPERAAVGGVEASELLVTLETVGAENGECQYKISSGECKDLCICEIFLPVPFLIFMVITKVYIY